MSHKKVYLWKLRVIGWNWHWKPILLGFHIGLFSKRYHFLGVNEKIKFEKNGGHISSQKKSRVNIQSMPYSILKIIYGFLFVNAFKIMKIPILIFASTKACSSYWNLEPIRNSIKAGIISTHLLYSTFHLDLSMMN